MEVSTTMPLTSHSSLRDHMDENLSVSINQNQTTSPLHPSSPPTYTSPLQPSSPPTYPCSEKCIKCHQPTVNTEQVENNESEQTQQCECECHKQDPELQQSQIQFPKDNEEEPLNLSQTQNPLQMTNNHIPPAGPNCLPGCGYSGLPCYNCTMGQTQTLESTQGSSATQGYFGNAQSANVSPGYPVQPNVQGYPQIYTVDLMNNSHMNQDRLSQTQILLPEEQGRRSRK
ncbi:unnamed protein product, partial [Meganyctiphanes norvegica]